MSLPFQKFIIGGSSGDGSKGGGFFFGQIMKIMRKLSKMRLLLPFLLFWNLEPLFKLSGSKPLKKQNKTKQNKKH